MPPPILLFGATSLLGFYLATLFPKIIRPFISPGNKAPAVREWPALKLDNPKWIEELLIRNQPEILLYCHAVCDVPKCEAYPKWAHEINVQQLANVIMALPQHTKLVYLSSDHVFGGDGVYTEESRPCPISVYGQTRIEAEHLVLRRPRSLVIRTGLGIGSSPNGRTGHLDWLRYRTQRKLPITIIEDEYRSAVWLHKLATRIMQVASSEESGIRHISTTRAVSRVELATYLMKMIGKTPTFNIQRRHQQPTPHLGRVELASVYQSTLFQPLPTALEG